MLLLGLVLPASAAAAPGAGSVRPFGHADVVRRAQALAARPYVPPDRSMPAVLAEMTYDQQQQVRTRPEAMLWPGHRFRVAFFLRGYLFRERVVLHVVDEAGVHDVPFAPELFDYGTSGLAGKVPQDQGFSGFQLRWAAAAGAPHHRLAEFLGASYFRVAAAAHQLGASARGLALDTAGPGPEEFPRFTEHWLVRPGEEEATFTSHALLDGPSVAGAYSFVFRPLRPGLDETVVEVQATLLLRSPVQKLGLAPLTSMFFYGENTRRPPGYVRPEVHDSDGLSLQDAAGRWLWRPLHRPGEPRESVFPAPHLRGFGLMQRDRSFASYEDLNTRYDLRPSVWVEPTGDWGRGAVHLVLLHEDAEFYDNCVAFWVPAVQPPPGRAMRLAYRLRWQGDRFTRPPGWVQQTLSGTDLFVHRGAPSFWIDFQGERLAALPAGTPLQAAITATGGGSRVLRYALQKNPVTQGWRLQLEVSPPPPGQRVELRAYLHQGQEVLTETWSYVLEE